LCACQNALGPRVPPATSSIDSRLSFGNMFTPIVLCRPRVVSVSRSLLSSFSHRSPACFFFDERRVIFSLPPDSQNFCGNLPSHPLSFRGSSNFYSQCRSLFGQHRDFLSLFGLNEFTSRVFFFFFTCTLSHIFFQGESFNSTGHPPTPVLVPYCPLFAPPFSFAEPLSGSLGAPVIRLVGAMFFRFLFLGFPLFFSSSPSRNPSFYIFGHFRFSFLPCPHLVLYALSLLLSDAVRKVDTFLPSHFRLFFFARGVVSGGLDLVFFPLFFPFAPVAPNFHFLPISDWLSSRFWLCTY